MNNQATEEKIRKLASLDNKKAHLHWLFYLSGEGKERNDADELMDIILHQQTGKDFQKNIHLDPPNADSCFGEFPLGAVEYPPDNMYCPFGLKENEWIKHTLITGMTGTGKTNLSFNILRQLTVRNKPWLVFDWKRNYRDLIQFDEFKHTPVFTVGRDIVPFRFNPLLPPPNIEPGEWLMKLVDVIKHAYFVGEGVEYLLREGIDWVYEKCGMFEKKTSIVPTCYEVRSYVDKQRLQGRMSLWKASAMRVLESLCFKHGLGPVVNANTAFEYETLLNANVILEMDALSDSDKIFLTEALILWIYEYRKTQGKREQFQHALIIEEGHHVLSQKKENLEGSETIMETSLRQIREFGEAVIVIDQEPIKLSNSIKANTYTKITFNLGNGKDAEEISLCMGLNKEESDYINLLEVGKAVVSMKGRINAPLLVAFPKIDLKKGLIQDSNLLVPKTKGVVMSE